MSDLIKMLEAMRPDFGDSPKPEAKPEPRGNFDCPECDLGFAHAPTLAEHMKAEHGENTDIRPEGKWTNYSGGTVTKAKYDRIVRHTEKATLFELQRSGTLLQYWLPKSKYYATTTTPMSVFVPEWFDIKMKQVKRK